MAVKQSVTPHTIIYLMRNDLRIHDNECFNYIATLERRYKNTNLEKNKIPLRLVPLYCFQSEHYHKGTYNFGFSRVGLPRARFLLETVKDLKLKLQNTGSDLIVKSCFTNKGLSNPTQAVLSIIEQLGLKAIGPSIQDGESKCTLIFHQEPCQEEVDTEISLNLLCKQYGIQVEKFWGASLYHKDDLPFNKIPKDGSSYIPDVPDVYTEFRKAVETKSKIRPIFPTPAVLPPLPDTIVSDDLPNITTALKESQIDFVTEDGLSSDESAFTFQGGETAALKRLHNYLWETNAVATYKENRNGLVGTEYSTKFSPWLANGSLSPRCIYSEIKKYEQSRIANQSTYWVIFELLWRDFFRFVCFKYGSKIFHAGGIRQLDVTWKQDLELFDKWKNGNTGIPFIDANMRELLKTGWMSNRGRQNVASFLVKDLKLDWRLGAEWFESMLIDHDVCSNYGNWNYAAGIGNDPREDRKFNIIKQSIDYDPNGEFIKIWVPEIAKLAYQNSFTYGNIHCPWKAKPMDLNNAGIKLGVTYPKPIIIAREWAKHFDNFITKSRGNSNNMGMQQKRGIDFYFKPANQSKHV